MPRQIKPSVTNPTISDLYESIESDRLILTPDFQRKFVWTHAHQEQFIDTILNGLPFPEIYICNREVDIKKLRTTKNVIDGQQRLTTIKNYIEGVQEKPFQHIVPFSELDDDTKGDFLSYQVVVRDIGDVDDDTVREIFRRINLTKFKLENVEIHNAVYDGRFISAAKTILENVSLEKYGVFKESEFTRMADLHFMLLVMSTLEHGGYFAQDREVEVKVAEYNDEYPDEHHMIALLLKVFAIINDLDLANDSIWFRKSNFFTLVVELAMHIEVLPPNLKSRLEKLEQLILGGKADPHSPYREYYAYMYQATHGRSARVTRSKFFRKDVLGLTV